MQAQKEFIMVKRKRSKRPSPLSLSIATTSSTEDVSDRLTPSPSNSGELTHCTVDEEEEDMAHCLILLARGRSSPPQTLAASAGMEAYQCKTCSKSFNSFQALGGHRASHKKPNKPPAEEKMMKPVIMREEDNTILSLRIVSNGGSGAASKSRVHECSICGAEFGSGQALGGHMRRHRPIAAAQGETTLQGGKRARNLLSLDLNLPAPEDEHTESKFPFAPKEQVIVFSASPLIDCHY